MHLLAPKARATGSVRRQSEDVLAAPASRMRALRGGKIAMIFQEPMTSLNPAVTVAEQIVEAIRAHGAVSAAKARVQADAWLVRVRGFAPAPNGLIRVTVCASR
jgi:ABC-type microcin C transport system duplicated ATPase subunit YejF